MLYSAKRSKGFTLVELIITVLIVAIMAAFAVPAYTKFVRKNAEEEARARLLSLSGQLASYRAKKLTYSGFKPNSNSQVGGNYVKAFDSIAPAKIQYLPLGSTSTNYKYQITFEISSLAWKLLAVPNPDHNTFKNNDGFYMDSLGTRCQLNKAALSTHNITNSNACDDPGMSVW